MSFGSSRKCAQVLRRKTKYRRTEVNRIVQTYAQVAVLLGAAKVTGLMVARELEKSKFDTGQVVRRLTLMLDTINDAWLYFIQTKSVVKCFPRGKRLNVQAATDAVCDYLYDIVHLADKMNEVVMAVRQASWQELRRLHTDLAQQVYTIALLVGNASAVLFTFGDMVTDMRGNLFN